MDAFCISFEQGPYNIKYISAGAEIAAFPGKDESANGFIICGAMK